MAYLLFLLANAALYIRPAELLPALGDVQVYLFFILASLVVGIRALHNQVSLKTIVQQPINLCVIGVTLATAISHLSVGYATGAVKSFTMMSKVCVYYLILVAMVNTPYRLKMFLLNSALCSVFMIGYSIYDYQKFVDEFSGRPDLWEIKNRERDLAPGEKGLLRHVPEGDEFNIEGEIQWYFRMCGLGIFHDPNDMAQLIVMTGILCLYFMADPKQTGIRYLWLPALGICVYGLMLTHSRGGILASGVALMAWLSVRYGGKVAMCIGALGALAVPIALGRQGNINVSEGTGQQRIQLWSDGLNQLKTAKLFFGIGEGNYAEVAGLVAHNSYVHAFVELGLFGGIFFVGCFFIPAYAIWQLSRRPWLVENAELQRMMPYLAGMGAGWCMSMTSLSRCYMPTTYMICGTMAAFLNLVGYYRRRPHPLLPLTHQLVQKVSFAGIGVLASFFVVVKLLARF